MRGRAILSAAWLVAVVGTSASAQSFGFELTGENHTPGPILLGKAGTPVTIELWAWFDSAPGVDLFASANFDIDAAEPTWLSSNVVLAGPGSSQGVFGQVSLTSMIATQAHDPSAGVFGSPDNPILLWTGQWTTYEGTTRYIIITTSNTTDFSVFDQQGNTTQLYPGSFRAPSIAVLKYPSPSTAVTLSGFVWITMRRRRV